MSSLYQSQKVKAYVTTTHGEGFGLPIFEAASYGVPVISPSWSGQKDFLELSKKTTLFCKVPHSISPVQPHSIWENVIEKESQWAHMSQTDIQKSLREVYENHKKYKRKATTLKKKIIQSFEENEKLTQLANSVLSPLNNKGEKNETI
jgi:glycosyltransferase involved in cell wall biosynthesis